MAQLTYANKVALNINPDVPIQNKVVDDDMNNIKSVVNANETKILIAVTSTAPAQCSTGDMYYNTSTKLIYTATATNTWGTTGVSPTLNTIYVEFTSQTLYAFDGTNLISVGGGSEIIVEPDTPTAGTKLLFEETDLDAQYTEAEYYSTEETLTNKVWINGKPIYRKVLSYTGNITNNLEVQHEIENLDKMLFMSGYFFNGSVQGMIPFGNRNTDYTINFDDISSTHFIWSVGSGFNLTNVPIAVVMEYTKTTD